MAWIREVAASRFRGFMIELTQCHPFAIKRRQFGADPGNLVLAASTPIQTVFRNYHSPASKRGSQGRQKLGLNCRWQWLQGPAIPQQICLCKVIIFADHFTQSDFPIVRHGCRIRRKVGNASQKAHLLANTHRGLFTLSKNGLSSSHYSTEFTMREKSLSTHRVPITGQTFLDKNAAVLGALP